ncbi:site-specific integrase [Brassicibacter mesophilus]|uniref:site-specific integrase n=1 Tax=Brassicibacter mesophilus TaxID=745119 RepID=UPI003D23F2C6
MGRKNKNIKIQLNNRVNDLLRIGQKKVKNNPTNANRTEGIHSIKTAHTYRQTVNLFADYLKTQGIRNIEDITRDHVQSFMLSRADNSAYTHSKDLSAINKILDTRYTVKEFGLPQRSYMCVGNNRGLAVRDTSDALRNREQLDFVRATGISRESIATITPKQAIKNSQGQVIGFNVTEKGGRERNAIVIEQERERITELVNQREQKTGKNIPMFNDVDSNANPHYFRREYAQQLYTDLRQAMKQERDYYSGMRETFINQANFEKAISRYSNETIKGYERDVLAEVSQNLGHNRIDVVLYHYLQ